MVGRHGGEPVGIAVGVTVNIAAEQGEPAALLRAHVNQELVLAEDPVGFVVVDGSDAAKRTGQEGAGAQGNGVRSVDIAGEQQMVAARVHVVHGEGGALKQLALDADDGLHEIGRAQGFIELVLRVEAGIDGELLRGRRGTGDEVGQQQRRIGDDVRNLGLAVEAVGVEHVAGFEAVVEEAEAAADDGFSVAAGAARVRRPGEADTRRPIAIVGNVGLRFPTQAEAQGEVLPDFPIVLHKGAEIQLIKAEVGIALRDGEAAGATAIGQDFALRAPCCSSI